MYTLVNDAKAKKAKQIAIANGFKADDEKAVVHYYARLGGLVRDKDGVEVQEEFALPKKEVKEEKPKVEAPKEEKPKEEKPKVKRKRRVIKKD